MKSLKFVINEALNESQLKTQTVKLSDFFQWACLGEKPDGHCYVSQVDDADVEGLIDNGWFDLFGENSNAKNKVKQFFKKNWDRTIKVYSKPTSNDWEVWFKLDGKEYVASFMSEFGDIQ